MSIIFILGLVLGSFVNALVWRLREQDKLAYPELQDTNDDEPVNSTEPAALVIPAKAGIQSKLSRSDASSSSSRHAELVSASRSKTTGSRNKFGMTKAKAEDYSIMRGRSMCPHCHHTLAAGDLVPVFSWLWLRGRCRYCHTRISWQYPVVELMTAALFVVSYVFWPLQLDALGVFRLVLWLIFVTGFVALAVYDLHWFELPDRIVWPLVVLAVLQTLIVFAVERDAGALVQAVLGAAVIAGLFGGLYVVSKGNWIGFGDVKLSLVLGLLAGTPGGAFLVIFLASIIGTLASLPLLLQGKHSLKKQIPFGPALLLATFIVVLFGAQIIDWYTTAFIPGA